MLLDADEDQVLVPNSVMMSTIVIRVKKKKGSNLA
jgi:hypothetical protein